MRVGVGYDSHRFSPDRRLVLGGVEIHGSPGLEGHSDADAVTHAVIDALLGAGGIGDIGSLFPDTADEWKDVSSMVLLELAVRRLEERNYQVVNVDVTVVTERPRIGPHAAGMRAALAGRLHVSPEAVSIKGKSNEGMGWIGRGEGIAVVAVALVDRIGDIDALKASRGAGG